MVDVALRNALLTPHNLALADMGRSQLTPKDIVALGALDPLTTSVISILNDHSKWQPLRDAREAGVELPPDAFLAVRVVTGPAARGGRVYDEQFVMLTSSARRAVETLAGLGEKAQSEVGLAVKTDRGLAIVYRVSDSFAPLRKEESEAK